MLNGRSCREEEGYGGGYPTPVSYTLRSPQYCAPAGTTRAVDTGSESIGASELHCHALVSVPHMHACSCIYRNREEAQ